MRQRDPGVLPVPDDRRDCADDKNREQAIQTRPFEFLPQARSKREHKQKANHFERICVTAEKPEPDQQSG